MSRRQQVLQQRKALQNGPPPELRQPQGQQMGIEALVPFLMQMGAPRGCMVQRNDEDKAIRIVVTLGPLSIPADFTDMAKARQIGNAILDACDDYDPPAEAADEPGPCDDLLAESINAINATAGHAAVAHEDLRAEVDDIFTAPHIPQLPAPHASGLILPAF